MCDVCSTKLFDFHWACGKCGFVVCMDCYKARISQAQACNSGTAMVWGDAGRDHDDQSWLLCTDRQPHEQERLMLTQIATGDELQQLRRRSHEVREQWRTPQHCGCAPSNEGPAQKPAKCICKVKVAEEEGKGKELESTQKDGKKGTAETEKANNSPLHLFPLRKESNNLPLCLLPITKDKKAEVSTSSGNSVEDKDGNTSFLRNFLLSGSLRRPYASTSRRELQSSAPPSNTQTSQGAKMLKRSYMATVDEVFSMFEHSEKREVTKGPKPVQEKLFVRQHKLEQHSHEPLPVRVMTITQSEIMYPGVPHTWLCNGRLLMLYAPKHSENYSIFQDQWKRGQPVLVSNLSEHLDMSLWHPDSFARCFGDEKNDLVNCITGSMVTNQPMRRFWEGFEHFSQRLKDDNGNAMLLKLRDWPPGNDFAQVLPSRFADLMQALPLPDYTSRTGRFNLASRLPAYFLLPDLGPKLYSAYGSALHPSNCTTNLHLDISDGVNVMVYVGIPRDGEDIEHIKEALRAVDSAGCDIMTRRRARGRGKLPGALWHIYNAADAEKIRDLLNKVAMEKGMHLEPHHDHIHDQSWYLDEPLRKRLYLEYGVEGYAIVQCMGDSVFIPAGAPYQVRNLHSCIKVAVAFVSPENISHCFHLTKEFGELSDRST